MEEDEDRKREGCAVGVLSCLVSDCGMLSALYNGSDACPLLELVTMASTWLSSRSMVDWSGLSPSGENAADTRCTAVCTGYVAPGENTTKTAMSYSSLLSLSLNFLLLSFLFIFPAIVVGLEKLSICIKSIADQILYGDHIIYNPVAKNSIQYSNVSNLKLYVMLTVGLIR